jgi:hypothetical protein
MAVACGPSFWVSDDERDRCQSCAGAFGLFLRRHHCRRCGEIFCDPCSAATAPLNSLDGRDLVRVCSPFPHFLLSFAQFLQGFADLLPHFLPQGPRDRNDALADARLLGAFSGISQAKFR